MELSVREWMIIIGALLIVAVLLDGYRRIRNENRHRIKVSLSRQAYRQARNPSPAVVDDVEPSNLRAELPNGGARVIGKGKSPVQLDHPAPVLLESVVIPPQPDTESDADAVDPYRAEIAQPFAADPHDDDDAFEAVETAPFAVETSPAYEPMSTHVDDDAAADDDRLPDDDERLDSDLPVEPAAVPATFASEPLYAADKVRDEPSPVAQERFVDEAAFEQAALESPAPFVEVAAASGMAIDAADERPNSLHEKRVGLWDDEPEPAAEEVEERRSPWHGFSFRRRDAEPSEPVRPQMESASQEVLAIYVVSRDGEPFKGQDLLQLLLACDLRFGKMNVFHRHEKPGGRGAVQFSVANIAEPGTFDLDRMEEVTTPGVCLFLVLPGPEAPYKAFDYMVETAQVLVKHLDGELRDDAHSALTRQTLEHCRQRIRDFERKQLTLHL